MSNPHQKELVKLLQKCGYRHHLYQVFADFVEVSAITLSSRFDWAAAQTREQRYLQITARYTPDEQKLFPQMFGEFVLAFDHQPGDVLGTTFGELELGNSAAGQFFTPYHLCRLMASITVGSGDGMKAIIAHRGFVTASEPACGAGAMVVALCEAMSEAGINYQQQLHVSATDVDSRAAHMAYLQCSLMQVPAVVIIGNTLSGEVRERWYTPAHCMGLWDIKLHRGYALGSAMDRAEVDVPMPAANPKPQPVEQLSLLERDAA